MPSWELLGGDPAPGSTDSVRDVGKSLDLLSQRARQATDDIDRIAGRSGATGWEGRAATLFWVRFQPMPRQLRAVADSYRVAAAALRTWYDALAQAQPRAQDLIRQAEAAEARRATAKRAEDGARAEKDSLTWQWRNLRAQRLQLVAEANLAFDPGRKANAEARLRELDRRLQRLEADVASATAEEREQTLRRQAAENELNLLRKAAENVRQQLTKVEETVVHLLDRAVTEADLPPKIVEDLEKLRETIITYGPAVVDALTWGASAFSIAATIFPPGAGVFGLGALICSGTAFLGTFALDMLDDGRIDGEELRDLIGKGISVGLAILPFGEAGSAGVAIAKAALTSADVGLQLDAAYRAGGTKGLIDTGIVMVVVGGGTAVAGVGLRKAIGSARARSPKVAAVMRDISRQAGQATEKQARMGLPVDRAGTQGFQSVLAGDQHRGFLSGGHKSYQAMPALKFYSHMAVTGVDAGVGAQGALSIPGVSGPSSQDEAVR